MNTLGNREYLSWHLFAAAVLLFYFFPLFSGRETLYIPVFDFLDIAVPSLKILAQSEMIFAPSDAVIPNMMGGLPRLSYGSEFNYMLWLFYMFTPYTAYMINEILMHFMAYLGMCLLLLNILNNEMKHRIVLTGSAALLFALLPFYPGMGLSVPLLPLVTYAFLKIRGRVSNWKHWSILVFAPFFSSFVLIYFFFLIIALTILLMDLKRTKKINHAFFAAILLMGILYCLIEYRLIIAMFFDPVFVSHRVEFIRKFVDFATAYRGGHNLFLLGQSHTITLQSLYIIPVVLCSVVLSLCKCRISISIEWLIAFFLAVLLVSEALLPVIGGKYFLPFLAVFLIILLWTKQGYFLLNTLLLITIFVAWWYGFWYYNGWKEMINFFPLIRTFDWSRFALLLPLSWYVMLGLAFGIVIKRLPRSGWLIVAVVFFSQAYWSWQVRLFYPNTDGLNFRTYFDTDLMEKVAKGIGKSKESYHVGSVGIPPAVSLFNGFYTVDGYSVNYPLSYKRKFERMIAGNFEQNENSKKFMENWGNQCYLIAGDKGYEEYKKGETLHGFKLNTELFQNMGGRYIISGYPIENASENNLTLINIYNLRNHFWSVWVYGVGM